MLAAWRYPEIVAVNAKSFGLSWVEIGRDVLVAAAVIGGAALIVGGVVSVIASFIAFLLGLLALFLFAVLPIRGLVWIKRRAGREPGVLLRAGLWLDRKVTRSEEN
jgi:hypothetical protein